MGEPCEIAVRVRLDLGGVVRGSAPGSNRGRGGGDGRSQRGNMLLHLARRQCFHEDRDGLGAGALVKLRQAMRARELGDDVHGQRWISLSAGDQRSDLELPGPTARTAISSNTDQVVRHRRSKDA